MRSLQDMCLQVIMEHNISVARIPYYLQIEIDFTRHKRKCVPIFRYINWIQKRPVLRNGKRSVKMNGGGVFWYSSCD